MQLNTAHSTHSLLMNPLLTISRNMSPKRLMEVPQRGPSTLAGQKNRFVGIFLFPSHYPSPPPIFLGQGRALAEQRSRSALSAPLLTGSARPYLLLHVRIAERHGDGGNTDGGSSGDSGGGGGRPKETRPVPSVAASGIRSGSGHGRRGHRGPRPPRLRTNRNARIV